MIILHRLMVIILKKRWSCVWTNMHWICFILISIPAFFKFEFIKFWLSYLGRLFIIWLPTSVFKSKLVQSILILIEFSKIHMGVHVISNHCSWYLFISQGAKMKSVTMHFCILIIGGWYSTLVFLKAHFKNYCILFVAALLIKFFMLHTCLHACSWR